MYPSEVVSEFGPLRGPRCRDKRDVTALTRREVRNASRRWRGGLDDALRRRRREDNLTHWLITTQVPPRAGARRHAFRCREILGRGLRQSSREGPRDGGKVREGGSTHTRHVVVSEVFGGVPEGNVRSREQTSRTVPRLGRWQKNSGITQRARRLFHNS